MVISRVRLVVRVRGVRVVPTGGISAGPSAGRYRSGPSTADGSGISAAHDGRAVPAAVVSGDVVMTSVRPKCSQADERGNGEGDERRENRLLRYEADGEVRESRQNSELHFRGDQKR